MKILASIAAFALLSSAAMADENYRPRDGEKYTPQQYCHWQNKLLPISFQEYCRASGLPVPKALFDMDGSGYFVDLNSVRVLPPNRFHVRAIVAVARLLGDEVEAHVVAFTCTDMRYSYFEDPNSEWKEGKEGSIMQGVSSIACAGTGAVP